MEEQYKESQVSDQFPPNKESEWSYPKERDGWFLAHNSLRGELEDVRVALTAVKGRGLIPWEVQAIKRFTAAHFIHIHGHHHNEDVIFVPFLKERFKYPDKFAADHEVLENTMENVQGLISDLKEGGTVDKLLEEWTKYEELSKPHFIEEEEVALPMMRAFFAPSEVGPFVQKIMQSAPKVEIGSFVYYQGVESFRNEFMPQEGIPSFVWMIDLKGKYNVFIREFKKPLDSLKSGVPVAPPKRFRFFTKFFSNPHAAPVPQAV